MDSAIHQELEKEPYQKLLLEEYAHVKSKKRGTHITSIKYEKLPSLLEASIPLQSKNVVITRSGEDIQMAFKLRGYLVRKDLPPITESTKLPDKAIWTTQFVTISGLGCDQFDNGLKVMATLYHIIGRKIGCENLSLFSSKPINGYSTLNFSRRYFSMISDGSNEPLSRSLDPFGRLAKFGKGLHHNRDNRVLYQRREKIVQADNSSEYVEISPTVFQVGQLVEVEFSLCARLCRSNWKVFHELEVLTLLDNTIDQFIIQHTVASMFKSRAISRPASHKREIDYISDEEPMVLTHKKLKLLKLGTETAEDVAAEVGKRCRTGETVVNENLVHGENHMDITN